MPAELTSTSQGQTMVLTIRNPEQRNALSPGMYAAGIEALSVAETLAEVRSVILTGEGSTFCSGGSLQRLRDNRRESPEVQAQAIEGLHGWIEAIRTFPKPIVAAVEGAAAGAGFSLALACDFIVAADDATFVMAYGKVGLSPDGGASWSLSRALPRQMVSELLLAGEPIGAQRLQALGVVNRCTAPGTALAGALQLCERLNTLAPNALASTKELMNEAPDATLSAQLAAERNHFVTNLHHPNAGIGIEAFLAKGRPHYS